MGASCVNTALAPLLLPLHLHSKRRWWSTCGATRTSCARRCCSTLSACRQASSRGCSEVERGTLGRIVLEQGFDGLLEMDSCAAMHATTANLRCPLLPLLCRLARLTTRTWRQRLLSCRLLCWLACVGVTVGAAQLVCWISFRGTTTGLLGACCSFGYFEQPRPSAPYIRLPWRLLRCTRCHPPAPRSPWRTLRLAQHVLMHGGL